MNKWSKERFMNVMMKVIKHFPPTETEREGELKHRHSINPASHIPPIPDKPLIANNQPNASTREEPRLEGAALIHS